MSTQHWISVVCLLSALSAPLVRATAQGMKGAPATVTFCAIAGNLPLSSDDDNSPGYEVELARAIAARAGFAPRFVWLDANHDRPEQAVRDSRCQVALGIPVDPGAMLETPLLEGLALTAPYYAAEYLVVRRVNAPRIRELQSLGETRIGVEGESVVAYTLRQRGYRVHVMPEHTDLLDAVAEGRVRYAYVWGPIAAWASRARRDVVLDTLLDTNDRWHFALAVRAQDAPLLARLNVAVAAVARDGTPEKVCRSYGLPRCAPTKSGGAR